jgi:hypothetical protein
MRNQEKMKSSNTTNNHATYLEFIKDFVKRQGYEDKTTEALCWILGWCHLSSREFDAIYYVLSRRVEKGEISAEKVEAMIEAEVQACGEYEESLSKKQK